MESADIIIIGGGIVGLATANKAKQAYPNLRVVLLERDAQVSQRQSSRPSSILETGIIRANSPDWLALADNGRQQMLDFCQAHDIPAQKKGQLLLAINEEEANLLPNYHTHGQTISLDVEAISAEQIPKIEPLARGTAALHIPETYTIEFPKVAEKIALQFELAQGEIITNTIVKGIVETELGVYIQTDHNQWFAPHVINTAGLYADEILQSSGIDHSYRIIPFRAESYTLSHHITQQINGIISPLPPADLPFTGIQIIHTNSVSNGSVAICGSNAVLAAGKDAYLKGRIELRQLAQNLTSRRIRLLTRNNLQTAVWEWRRSWSKSLFALTAQRLIPSITENDLISPLSTIQAYAVRTNGQLASDNLIIKTERTAHFLYAPDGATIAFSLADSLLSIID